MSWYFVIGTLLGIFFINRDIKRTKGASSGVHYAISMVLLWPAFLLREAILFRRSLQERARLEQESEEKLERFSKQADEITQDTLMRIHDGEE